MTQREAFEKWADSEGYSVCYNYHGAEFLSYISSETQSAYQGWQAALSQPQQEPVGKIDATDDGDYGTQYWGELDLAVLEERGFKVGDNLYLSPPSTEALEAKCKCNIREKLVGDGCQVCNPQVVIDCLKDEVAELTAKLDKAREAFTEIRNSLQFANDSVGGAITDTIWMMHEPQTLFDAFDEALEELSK